MNDVDKILEAEQTIITMAEELKKMKEASNLLSSSQEKVDELIRSSEQVITLAGNFTQVSGQIIRRLNDMDIDTRLSELKGIGTTTSEKVDEYSGSFSRMNDVLIKETQGIKTEILGTVNQRIDSTEQGLKDQNTKISEDLSKNQKGQKLLFAISIVNILFLISLLILFLLK